MKWLRFAYDMAIMLVALVTAPVLIPALILWIWLSQRNTSVLAEGIGEQSQREMESGERR
jgi:hypothetical protein